LNVITFVVVTGLDQKCWCFKAYRWCKLFNLTQKPPVNTTQIETEVAQSILA